MGSVYRKSVTRPLPAGAELFTKGSVRFARWKPIGERARTAKVIEGADGSRRVRTEAATFTAKYRDGEGVIREVATGCRDEDAARPALSQLERSQFNGLPGGTWRSETQQNNAAVHFHGVCDSSVARSMTSPIP
jgi:hypothetical protein